MEGYNGKHPQFVFKEYEGIPVICMYQDPRTGADITNRNFNQMANDADLRVYFVTSMVFPEAIHPCVAISHGIFWDSPHFAYRKFTEEQRKHWMKIQLFGFTQPDYVVAVDHNTRNVIQAIEPGCESRIYVIPNYVDTEVFKPAPKTWEGIRILFPRRSTLIRGWNLFSTAARELPEYEFIACGDALDESKQEDLENNVSKMIPNLRQEHRHMNDMVSLYQSVDIAVIPTLACEGSSLSEIEAMACGLPVITTGVGGTLEFIVDGYNGVVFDPHHHRLSEVIKHIVQDEELRKKLGQRARETAVECFDKRSWWNEWRKIIPPAKEV